MNILVVQESDWIRRGPHNTHHLLERLSERGHQVRVIDYGIEGINHGYARWSKRSQINNYQKVRAGANVTIVRPTILHIAPLNYLSLLLTHFREIRRQIASFQPDIVIGLGIMDTYLAINECQKQGIPFVYFVLDPLHTLIPDRAYKRIARLIESENCKSAPHVIVVNKLLKDYVISMGADASRITLLPHGAELDRFASASKDRDRIRKEFGFDDQDTVLFFMGLLYEFSGLLQVADSLKIDSEYPGMKLLVVGEGPAGKKLSEIRVKTGKNLTLLEWQPYERIPAIISAVDICILPAEINDVMRSIVPIKILEYMAAGKAIIATKLPGVIAEIGYDNGIIYVGSPEDVVPKGVELVKMGRVAEVGTQGLRYVERLDWDDLSNTFEQFLSKLTVEKKEDNTQG